MVRVSILGVVVGGIADILLTFVLQVMVLGGVIPFDQVPPDQVSQFLEQALLASPSLMAMSFITGGVATLIGGCVAARIAGHDEVLNGALSAWICAGTGLYALVSSTSTLPAWLIVLSILLSVACAAVGGILILRGKSPGPARGIVLSALLILYGILSARNAATYFDSVDDLIGILPAWTVYSSMVLLVVRLLGLVGIWFWSKAGVVTVVASGLGLLALRAVVGEPFSFPGLAGLAILIAAVWPKWKHMAWTPRFASGPAAAPASS
jgi:hypothetical protein